MMLNRKQKNAIRTILSRPGPQKSTMILLKNVETLFMFVHSHHIFTDLIFCESVRLFQRLNSSLINNENRVGERHDLIKFQRDKQDRLSLIPEFNDLVMDVLYRSDIESSRGLHEDDKIPAEVNFACYDRLLLVSPAHTPDHRGGAFSGPDIVVVDQNIGFFGKLCCIKNARLRAEGLFVVTLHTEVFSE